MSITVKQLLSKKPTAIHAVTPTTLVIDAIRKMSEQQIGALLVIQDDKLAGIFSERDYTRKVILKNRASNTTKVSEIMTNKVHTVEPEQMAEECMVVMSKYHIRHLPVVENDAPIGMLTIMDLLKNIISEKEFIIEQLEHYITSTA